MATPTNQPQRVPAIREDRILSGLMELAAQRTLEYRQALTDAGLPSDQIDALSQQWHQVFWQTTLTSLPPMRLVPISRPTTAPPAPMVATETPAAGGDRT
jgi:hypothetical protein